MTSYHYTGIILVLSALLFPVGGWLADAHIGRHKMVQYSTWIMWIGTIVITVGEILAYVSTTYDTSIRKWVIYAMFAIMASGLGAFQSTIIQFGIDQLKDASTTEIVSFITWYVLILYASGITLQYATDCFVYIEPDNKYFFVKSLAVAVCLTLALSSNFLFQHWLVKESITGNSFRLIVGVVKYTLKNRKLRYTFAIDEVPSRLDVAKHKYGGPFSSQQVEDVKSFLEILILIATCTIVCSGINAIEYAKEKIERRFYEWQENNGLHGCYERLTILYNDYLTAIVLVLLYEFVIYPLCNRCLPQISITKKFLLGIVFFLLRIISLLSIEIVAFTEQLNSKNTTVTCIFTAEHKETIHIGYKWLLIPGFMSALSSLLFLLSAFEFIWAQTPYSMTGLVLGIMYAFLGLNTSLQVALASPFLFVTGIPWKSIPLTCGIWYFIMQSIIVFVVLIVGMVMFKRYKRRDRNDRLLTSYTTVSYS